MSPLQTSASTRWPSSDALPESDGLAATPSRKCRILVIVRPRRPHLVADFTRIGEYVRQLDPNVQLRVVPDLPQTFLRPAVWSRPTLSIALRRLLMFRPLRGPLYQCWPHTKIDEYRRLDAAGIPVPQWDVLRAGQLPDLSTFGPVVVVKPAAGGGKVGVRLIRPGEVRYERPTNRGTWRCRDLVVQRFIYTGPRPAHYRVSTFLGQALFSVKIEADASQSPLPHPDELGDRGIGLDPTALFPHPDTRHVCLSNDADIIAFAERAHRAAFSDVPLLGADIIREHGTGRLFLTEVNAGGSTWHFSTRSGRQTQEKFGFRFESQFDAFHKAARILVEQARLHAR